ncbi:putative CoA-transferase [Mycobacterium montefiorense]|uniref:CoA-transferase n=3 Tax=Mycobacterium montefiorense TaxID=154654 RepID=A0AA37PJJ3_9MYCO|nr:putative CoA-transferase [Mycobacterium montefiorense]GKU32731.1 putative CoA-transferase [Mycobacterium montefiorense]GKU38253.1 putative CoA-transferase [Mycobacterium montefiorense]GKU47399.1 putative CoA-transferase [Mycobacterium montefiorense]GKU50282.1 putative CoA-transferase [Mycobacterium montefiorense]
MHLVTADRYGGRMADRLLAGVRVLDLSGGVTDAVTRLLADLGADVVKVEPPGGSPARDDRPTLAGAGIPFAVHNANKRSVVCNPLDDDDRRTFFELVGDADIVVDAGPASQAAAFGTTCAQLADRYPHLVALSISDFGTTGPRSSWRATDPVLFAMSGSLSRSGPTTGTPVLPPDGIASATAAVQATWAALVAYYDRLRCGTGDYIDFSRFDAVVMALDPAFGAHGQATAGQRSSAWRGRPKNQDPYPICPCQDGYVRLCVMAPRQWRGLRRWLGEPEEFQDAEYDTLGARFAAWPQISVLVDALFADKTMKQLVAQGQAHGVPISAVLTPSRILASEHFQAVGAIINAELVAGVHTDVPTGYFVVDDERSGFRTRAPAAGADEPRWLADPVAASPTGQPGEYPFKDLRILDLGVIVAGGELSRLFGDLGAQVIKVESANYPDGLRQSRVGAVMSESFAWTHRNHLALGLDLRSEQGKEIFARLVAEADAVFANFKPGTLTSLGFSFDKLRECNPRIVLAGSSAFGNRGPWSRRMGYGPLVRATTGVTSLWTSEEASAEARAAGARHAFYDATTIFPDHVVGRVTAIAALAALIRRDRTGDPAHVHISQAEVVVNQLDTLYVTQAALRAGVAEVSDDTSVHAVYPCAGDDEWCAISIRSDNEWRCATAIFQQPQLADDPRFATGESRATHRAELVELVSCWTRTHTPVHAAEALQAAGIAAGPMNRPPDVLQDPQLIERKLLSDMAHPLVERPLPAETGPALFRHIPPAPQRPAPLPGQDTRELCGKLLGMSAAEIDRLISDQVLFAPATTA